MNAWEVLYPDQDGLSNFRAETLAKAFGAMQLRTTSPDGRKAETHTRPDPRDVSPQVPRVLLARCSLDRPPQVSRNRWAAETRTGDYRRRLFQYPGFRLSCATARIRISSEVSRYTT